MSVSIRKIANFCCVFCRITGGQPTTPSGSTPKKGDDSLQVDAGYMTPVSHHKKGPVKPGDDKIGDRIRKRKAEPSPTPTGRGRKPKGTRPLPPVGDNLDKTYRPSQSPEDDGPLADEEEYDLENDRARKKRVAMRGGPSRGEERQEATGGVQLARGKLAEDPSYRPPRRGEESEEDEEEYDEPFSPLGPAAPTHRAAARKVSFDDFPVRGSTTETRVEIEVKKSGSSSGGKGKGKERERERGYTPKSLEPPVEDSEGAGPAVTGRRTAGRPARYKE